MNSTQRAFRYLRRNWKKTILLFLIFYVICSMILNSLIILRASNKIVSSMKSETQVQIVVEAISSDKLITDDMVEKITALDNVVSAKRNGDTRHAYPVDFTNFQGGRELDSELDSMVTVYACDDIETNYWFLNQLFYITKGKEINESSNHELVIDYILAEQNGLHVGDTMTFKAENGRVATGTIAGLFRATENERTQADETTIIRRIENYIYMDHALAAELFDDSNRYATCYFFLNNPDISDNTLEQVVQIIGADYEVTVSDSLYSSLQGPLIQIIRLVFIMLIFTVITSAFITSLLLWMWLRGRMKEMAVLLALGGEQYALFLQSAVESSLIFMIAAIIAATTSHFTSGIFEKLILSNQMGILSNIDYGIRGIDFLGLLAVGLVVLAVSVGISMIQIARLNPKEALSMLE